MTMTDNKDDTYRYETGTLFEWSTEHNGYLAVWTDYRHDTMAKAIQAYEGGAEYDEYDTLEE